MYVEELHQSCSKSTYYPIIPKFYINEGVPSLGRLPKRPKDQLNLMN